MKKFFTLIAAVAIAASVNAQDFIIQGGTLQHLITLQVMWCVLMMAILFLILLHLVAQLLKVLWDI